jgi:protein-disulfide isomerase
MFNRMTRNILLKQFPSARSGGRTVDTEADQDERCPTRTQRRERARLQRLAQQQAQEARATRRSRPKLLAVVLTIIVTGLAVVLIASPKSGAPRGLAPQGAGARAADARIASLLRGIPQSGDVLGQPTAPVTLQYFGDLQCPVCRSFSTGALPSIVRRWVRGGQLKIEYRSLETATREPEIFSDQQLAALAAGKQGRLWNFVEIFYLEQQEEGTSYVTERFILGIAQQVPGLDLYRWGSDRSDPALSARLAVDAQTANNDGLNGTPAFLVGRSGRTMSKLEPSSFADPGSFNEAIEASMHT